MAQIQSMCIRLKKDYDYLNDLEGHEGDIHINEWTDTCQFLYDWDGNLQDIVLDGEEW